MKTRTWMAVVVVLAMLAVAGCASKPRMDDDERLALFRAHAGEPVDSFRFFGRLNGWTPLGDGALAVWTRPGEAWLLELSSPCQDLRFSRSIGLTSTMSRVHARFDRVITRGSGMDIPCLIREIRPLDVKALRATEQELREAQVQEREATEGTP